MITTIETHLQLDTKQEHHVNACIEAWSTAYHQTWRLFNNHHHTEKQIYDALMASDAFTSSQARSLINKVTTEHSKIKALTKYQLTQQETKLKHINAFIQKESKAIVNLDDKVITLKKAKYIKYVKIVEHVSSIKTKILVIEAKKKKATRLEKSIDVLQCRIDTNTFKLCFGSTTLLKQHPKHPSESYRKTKNQKVYATVDEWRSDWTLARQNIWYAVGDRSKPQGHAEIQYDPVSYGLRLRLTETVYREQLKTIALDKDIPFEELHDHAFVKWGGLRLQARFMDVKDVAFCPKLNAKIVNALAHKQPISAKVMKRRCPDHKTIGFYLQLSFDGVVTATTNKVTSLIMGVDLNQKGLAYCIVKDDGNKLKQAKGQAKVSGFLPWRLNDKTSEQREWVISNRITELLDCAQSYGIHKIAIEQLDFKENIDHFNAGYKHQTSYHKMLTQFAKTQFSTLLQRKAARLNMTVALVTPRYSSIGGFAKFGLLNKLPVDMTASLWLARQALYGKRFKSESNTEHMSYFKEAVTLPYGHASKQSKKCMLNKVKWSDISSALGKDRKHWWSKAIKYIRPTVDPSLFHTNVVGMETVFSVN